MNHNKIETNYPSLKAFITAQIRVLINHYFIRIPLYVSWKGLGNYYVDIVREETEFL